MSKYFIPKKPSLDRFGVIGLVLRLFSCTDDSVNKGSTYASRHALRTRLMTSQSFCAKKQHIPHDTLAYFDINEEAGHYVH